MRVVDLVVMVEEQTIHTRMDFQELMVEMGEEWEEEGKEGTCAAAAVAAVDDTGSCAEGRLLDEAPRSDLALDQALACSASVSPHTDREGRVSWGSRHRESDDPKRSDVYIPRNKPSLVTRTSSPRASRRYASSRSQRPAGVPACHESSSQAFVLGCSFMTKKSAITLSPRGR